MIFLLLSFFDLTPHPKHRFKFQVSNHPFHPLRPLREIERIRILFLHADYAKSAEYFLFSVSRWRWRCRELRYDKSAQSACKWLYSFRL